MAREEAAILPEVAPGGTAIINADAPHLLDLARTMLGGRKDVAVVTFGGAEGADLKITAVEQDRGGITVTINGREAYRAPLLGRHNAWNVAAAVAVGKRLGLDAAAINEGLARAKGPEHRLTRVVVGGVEVIDDAYNANPESMRAALETFAEIAKGAARRVVRRGLLLVVLGILYSGGLSTEWPNIRKPSSNPHFAVSTSQTAFWTAIDCAMIRWWCTRSAGGSG